MATITDAVLSITHDERKKLASVVVNCKVNFTPIELCQMKACAVGKWFKLKCQLWGSDSGIFGADDQLYTFSKLFYFPDPTPSAVETCTFNDTLGEGVLDEDWGEDEVYAKLTLYNLITLGSISKKTNTVHHHF